VVRDLHAPLIHLVTMMMPYQIGDDDVFCLVTMMMPGAPPYQTHITFRLATCARERADARGIFYQMRAGPYQMSARSYQMVSKLLLDGVTGNADVTAE